jgi:hypothetical protein
MSSDKRSYYFSLSISHISLNRINHLHQIKLNPNVSNLHRGKTRQSASDVASRSLGQVEAYLTVREILAEASKGTDGVLWREFSGFGRFRSATLG